METFSTSWFRSWQVNPRRSYQASRRYHAPLEVQTQAEMPTTTLIDASHVVSGALQVQVQRCMLSWSDQLAYCQAQPRAN
ncbi:MAG: hypothetical protein AAF399_18735 [Bacteroidota bacterium]